MEHSELEECADRTKVLRLERAMRELPQAELETFHYFADGMYARVLPIVASTTIVGKVHKREHLYICTKGSMLILGDDGVKTLKSGDVVVSKPGTKRAIYALEDSICMTVHRTEKTDLDDIENELIEHDDLALFDSANKLKALT